MKFIFLPAKNCKGDHAKLAFWQLVEDEDVQQQLRTAATRLREAGQRFSHLRGPEAVEDKKLYDKVREAATSLARALKLLGPKPEPPKKKQRGLQLVVLVATAGAVKLILNKSRSTKGVIDGDPQGQSDRVPQGAGPQREGAEAGAGAA